MHIHYRVLLPEWAFKDAERTKPIQKKVEQYMQRYPGYVVLRVENGFAICDRESY